MPRSASHTIFGVFVVIVSATLSADAAEIQLKKSVSSQGSLILLGDIAQIRDDDPQTTRSLARVELFPAPATGRARTVRVREVRELLRLNGVDLATCKFSGAETVRVISRPRPASAKPSSRKTKPASKPTESIVVAVRPLQRGAIVSAADVELRPQSGTSRRISAVRGSTLFHQVDAVVGLEIMRSIRSDQPLEPRMLRRPLLVRRGDVIRVIARASGVTIKTTARATHDGAAGDLVTLQSETNKEKFLARVTGLGQAEVYASGTVVRGAPTRKPAIGARRRPQRR